MIKGLLALLILVISIAGFTGFDDQEFSELPSRRDVISCAPGIGAVLSGFTRISHPRLVYPGDPSPDPKVMVNDNRKPAGTLKDNVLELSLEVKWGDFFLETDTRPGLKLIAVSEKGNAPTIPAPLIRVREGNIIHAAVHNALRDSTITVFGLQQRPSQHADSLVINPGETKDVRFVSGRPGTYLYWVKLGAGPSPDGEEEEQLGGAFIIDPEAGSPPDRVMVMNVFSTKIDSALFENGWLESLTINGKSWPYTELFTPNVGDTMNWRVINASDRVHPMHLHGFMYKLLSKGSVLSDHIYKADMQPAVVTETMMGKTTMQMKWVASRPGNWLFHCHFFRGRQPWMNRVMSRIWQALSLALK